MNDNKNPNPPKPFPWAAYIGILGQMVQFSRVNEKDEVEFGEGRVEAIFLAADRRPQCRVHAGMRPDGKAQVYNVDFGGIEVPAMEVPAPPPPDKDKYVAHVTAIRELANEANAKIKDIGTAANAEIEGLNVGYMGDSFPV